MMSQGNRLAAWLSRNRLLSACAASMATVAWLTPIVAGIATIAARLGWMQPWTAGRSPIGIGLLTAGGLWLASGAAALPLASPRHVNARSWSVINVRSAELRARLASRRTADNPWSVVEAHQHLDYLDALLADGAPGLRWTTRSAYVSSWDRIHRTEELLLMTAEIAELGWYVDMNRLRLESAIGMSPQLTVLLEDVIRWLDRVRHGGRWAGLGRHWLEMACRCVLGERSSPAAELQVRNLDEARWRLREVTAAVNAFRARNWAGLIQLRNQTLIAALITECFGYGLLALAVASPTVSGSELVAGIVYFLVGATVGLLNHVIALQRSPLAVDDYGLEEARLTFLPVLAGMAGMAGVILVAILANTSITAVLQASSSANATEALPNLARVLSLNYNRAGLIFAALFGIAPGLLIARLRGLARSYEAAISSTNPATTEASPDGAR